MGAKYYWTVEAQDASGGAYYPVEFQALSISYGRSQPTDDFPAGQVSISGIKPGDLPAVFSKVKSTVKMTLKNNAGAVKLTQYCQVRSLTRTYGTTANLDTWSFNGIGALGELGEQQLTSDYTLTAGMNTCQAITDLLSAYGISSGSNTGSSLVSGTTFTTGTYLNDIVQEIIRTEQGRLQDTESNVVLVTSRSTATTPTIQTYFNDGTIAVSTANPYMTVDFVNNGEYLANTVIVEPEGLADQVTGSTKPVLNFQTLDQTSAQAADLAGYIKNTIDLNTVRPASITFNLDAQPNEAFLASFFTGCQVRVDLRGTSYACIVEGVSFSANPSTTEATLLLSSADAYSFLRLDDVTFGTLDYNKLGF